MNGRQEGPDRTETRRQISRLLPGAGAGLGKVELTVVLLAVVALVGLVTASATAAPAPGEPSLPAMAIASTDLTHGAVRRQAYGRQSGFVRYYKREFRKGAGFHRARFLGLEADVGLAADAKGASNFVSGLERAFKSKRLRRLLVKQLAGSAPKGLKMTFGRVTSLAVGDGAFMAPMSINFEGFLTFPFAIAVVRVDRVDQMLLMLGMPGSKLRKADVAALLKVAAAHMTTGLTPTVVTPPTITGTPQSGQTLTASRGFWTNAPSSYAYQWLRCDSTGANCVPIDGAAASTYVVTDADVGSTIRVQVTATGAVATSAPAQSDPTAVIAPAPAPLVRPTVSVGR